jgi:hypothetical protein
MLWEKLFCVKGRTNAEFSTMTDCKVVLSNCHNEPDDNVSGIPADDNVSGIPADDNVSGIPSVVELLAIASAKMNIN